MNTDTNELIAAAEIGDQARAFLESELGKCILGMAEQEVLAAQEQLGTISPVDEKGITALQNKIFRAKSFEAWLQELLADGENALSVFRQTQE